MTKKQALKLLLDLQDEVLTWRARDGGLTWHAIDVLKQLNMMIRDLRNNRILKADMDDYIELLHSADTGLEQEMYDIIIDYIRSK